MKVPQNLSVFAHIIYFIKLLRKKEKEISSNIFLWTELYSQCEGKEKHL